MAKDRITRLTPEQKRKLDALFRKYAAEMQRISISILKNPEDAEDAVQEALITIVRHIDSIVSVDAPKTRSFVMIVARSRALDILKRRDPSVSQDVYELADRLDSGRNTERELAETESLKSRLGKLRPEYREILLLRFDNGFSTEETADILDISYDNAKRTISRAREALKKIMEEDDEQ